MIKLSDFHPLPEGKDQFPLEFIEQRRVIKLGTSEGRILVGIQNSDDEILKAELQHFLKVPIEFLPIAGQELAEHLSGVMSQTGIGSGSQNSEKTRLDKLANDAPIVNLANTILLEGLRRGCSDIHIEAQPRQVRVRYRIDGVLQTGRILNKEIFPSLSSRIKIMANLDIIERRQPQDGRLSVQTGDQTVEFRVSIIPMAEGESIVLRVFQRHGEILSLPDLGFSPEYLPRLRKAATASHGLLLITGPTGSGKTTTLNALMREVSREEIKVITIEDPVENVLDGVNQIQTNEAIGLGFDTLLRRILRQDPDVLMVGEVRDRVTADLTVRAALTGHLVFSTLHTNDALSAVSRLTDMGVEPFLLGSVLRAVGAQRLVRKICPHCREEVPPTSAQKSWRKTIGAPITPLYHGAGCEACRQTGYQGRTVVAEIFPIDEEAEEIIISEKRHGPLESHFRSLGLPFLQDDALRLVREGITTLAEIERAVFIR
jgi:type II secretory ATPase GspE/PulE/Tfp pilus assembly ATPase PilB-like protein